jgi:uncharacterized HhH-GPD family protein
MNQAVELILKFRDQLREEGRLGITRHSIPEEAAAFLNEEPLAFLIGVLCDQGILAEKAWVIPWKLKERLGYFSAGQLASVNYEDLTKAMAGPPALHRFPNRMSEFITAACRKVVERYNSLAGNIWFPGSTCAEIQARLEDFWGIGQKKASMAVNILVRDMGVEVTDYENIDVSYDVHVRRVFQRTDLAQSDTEKAIVEAGRLHNPEYPGALDLPCWVVGREWCRPTTPDCWNCPLTSGCPQLIEKTSE